MAREFSLQGPAEGGGGGLPPASLPVPADNVICGRSLGISAGIPFLLEGLEIGVGSGVTGPASIKTVDTRAWVRCPGW